MKRIYVHVVMVFSMLLLLQGCVKENTSVCQSVLLLRFAYTLNDQSTNLFDDKVNKITLYVFDSKGKYVGRFSEQGQVLTSDYIMSITLPGGKYSVVAFGGDFSTYSVGDVAIGSRALVESLRPGITDIKDFKMEFQTTTGADSYLHPLSVADDLYACTAYDVPSVVNNQTVTDIDLILDTKKIKVKVKGLNSPSVPMDVAIMAANGSYLADNSLHADQDTIKYTPLNTTFDGDSMQADLKTIRLTIAQSPRLVVSNPVTLSTIYNADMVEQIMLTGRYRTQKDLDREDEFVFELTLSPTDNQVLLGVSVNGWKINNITPQI